GLFILLAGTAEVLARLGRRWHSIAYAFGSGGVALLSLLLVTLPHQGRIQAVTAMVVYGLYGAGSLVMNVRWRRPMVSSMGLALLMAATLWGLGEFYPQRASLWGAVLAVEALAMAVLAVVLGREGTTVREESPVGPFRRLPFLSEPLARSGEGITFLAIVA